MNPRFTALHVAGHRGQIADTSTTKSKVSSENFATRVFNRSVMKKMLPPEIYQNLVNTIEGKEQIKQEYANAIASAMKEWAMSHGATHYTHWFQPLTGASAEKHDSFIDWNTPDGVIEKFSGKQLFQGEPDASSFPSGGLRSTYEARGYTGWDPSSPAFLWTGGDGVTLCIPSVFFSWTGDVLDSKIPLLRSDHRIQDTTLRLLKLTGTPATRVFSTLGLEQEYFVIDRALRNLRPDLLLLGRTVFGAAPSKGQELQDHYFGSVKDRILRFMRDFESEAIKLGIPVKTRHNEVAPAQHEIAPVYEKASVAIDHNLILMELMRQIAVKHDLSCLLHEKPFARINGSGKHCNWALGTDTGFNLLDPTDSPENSIQFLILLTAILNAVHRHSTLLRASIGSAANDHRLGGHEAPPAIISVYLGLALEEVLDNIEQKGSHERGKGKDKYHFGIPVIPELPRDNTDRNRTSPFAFTGNKFEFRAVGSSASPSMPATVLNTIVAESLGEILDEIEASLPSNQKTSSSSEALAKAALPVIQKYLKQSKPIRFSGDNYSDAWTAEAKKRKLPNLKKSREAFDALTSKSTVKAFQGILTESELASRYEIVTETYAHTMDIDAKLMVELFKTQILPAALLHQEVVARSVTASKQAGVTVSAAQKALLKEISVLIGKAIDECDELELQRRKASALSGDARGKAYCDKVAPCGEKLRHHVDEMETLVDDKLWPLPKYRELLFLI